MKPRVERPNHFELHARAAKTDALVAELLRIAAELHVTPSLMLHAVAVWGPREWAQLALNLGKRPPSQETVTAVLATLSRAAYLETLAEATP